jgi:hypothetical protein
LAKNIPVLMGEVRIGVNIYFLIEVDDYDDSISLELEFLEEIVVIFCLF